MALAAGYRGLAAAARLSQAAEGASPVVVTQLRAFATVPEFWGKDSPYHGNTDFLGTPTNHRDLAVKRPVSPHVFEVDQPTKFHYKMPINAVSSILNRVTGVALTATSVGAGALALNGDLLPLVDWVRESVLVYPARAVVAGPLIYHYAAGIRHMVWDTANYGMQSEQGDLLDPKVVDQMSWALIYGSTAATLAAVVYSF